MQALQGRPINEQSELYNKGKEGIETIGSQLLDIALSSQNFFFIAFDENWIDWQAGTGMHDFFEGLVTGLVKVWIGIWVCTANSL